MSDFIDAMADLLPEHNSLKKKDNQLRKVLDRTVGAWFDGYNVLDFYDQLFINTATGKWLDLHGKDYGVYRKSDESDDVFRNRIIMEKNDNLTPSYLQDLYGVKLYCAFDSFNPKDNDLTSDNPYISNFYCGIADTDTQKIVNNKFILDNAIVWFDGRKLDYIIDKDGNKLLKFNLGIYNDSSLENYFLNSNVKYVKLNLPNAVDCTEMFIGCSKLKTIDLYLPNVVNCMNMFTLCTQLETVNLYLPNAVDCTEMFSATSISLDLDLPNAVDCTKMFKDSIATSVKLNLPNLDVYTDIFYGASSLESIEVTIPSSKVTGFVSYVLGLNLDLTSFIVNGEEVDLS